MASSTSSRGEYQDQAFSKLLKAEKKLLKTHGAWCTCAHKHAYTCTHTRALIREIKTGLPGTCCWKEGSTSPRPVDRLCAHKPDASCVIAAAFSASLPPAGASSSSTPALAARCALAREATLAPRACIGKSAHKRQWRQSGNEQRSYGAHVQSKSIF